MGHKVIITPTDLCLPLMADSGDLATLIDSKLVSLASISVSFKLVKLNLNQYIIS